jgi:integrase
MEDERVPDELEHSGRQPWNKGKLIGAKPPLRPSHVSIRTKLQMAGRKRDLALFNLAIDSKLRGCDVVAVRVDDVTPNGYAMDRATIRQKKTGRPVRFELTDQTRLAIDEYLRLTGRKPGQFLFPGRGDGLHGLTTKQYARLVHGWVASIGARSGQVRHPLVAPYKGCADLPLHWQSARSPTVARACADR